MHPLCVLDQLWQTPSDQPPKLNTSNKVVGNNLPTFGKYDGFTFEYIIISLIYDNDPSYVQSALDARETAQRT